MEKVKRVSCSVDATSIDPPCPFAISLTMKSPRPRPCWLRRTAPLKKGWNSCARAAGGIGTPPLAQATQALDQFGPAYRVVADPETLAMGQQHHIQTVARHVNSTMKKVRHLVSHPY